MPHTFTTAERLAARGAEVDCHGRLQMKGPDDEWFDVSTTFDPLDFLNSVTLHDDIDANTMSFSAELLRDDGTALISLAPLLESSTLNRDFADDYAPKLDLHRMWRVFSAVVDHGTVVGGSSPTVEALVIAGGASGGHVPDTGNSYSGGGGGAGGFLYEAAHALPAGSYPVVVGAGGTGSTTTRNNGANSTFDTMTAIGGGAGAEGSSGGFPNNPGNNGGSGGGGSRDGAGGTATAGQGSNGGTGTAAFGSSASGGGKGAVGTHSGSNVGAAGGAGSANSISGASVTYAGGGGSGGYGTTGGAGGSGGGGAGGGDRLNGVAATANTGGGGGGAGSSVAGVACAPGNGGSGTVVIRYATADFGACTGGTITTDGADTIHTFTADGTFLAVAADMPLPWHEIGKGYIDTINVNDIGNPSISVTGRGEEAIIIDCEILEKLVYSPGSTDDMETVIQELLDNNMGFNAPTLYVPTATSFIINEYTQDYGNLKGAIDAVAALAGYVVRCRYDTDGINKLMLFRPNREAEEGEEDWEIGPSEYLALPLNKLDKLGIRNHILVRYIDEANGLEAEYFTPDPPTSDSISRYGQRDLPIELGEDTQLTNSARVVDFALAIRSDLEFPSLEQELESYGLWWVQLTDWVKTRPNSVTY